MKSIKKLIGSFLPIQMKNFINQERKKRIDEKFFKNDQQRYFKHSGIISQNNKPIKIIASIAQECHVVEKGLTMPNMRYGFGIATVNNLVNLCFEYLEKELNQKDEMFLHAISVLNEYLDVHLNKNSGNQDLLLRITKLIERIPFFEKTEQIEISKDEYFKDINSTFEVFSSSRHSLRNYSGPLDTAVLIKAIKLAQNAPSSCNRQTSRAYVFKDQKKVQEILAFQNGNRGFGHLADKVIVVTAELGVYKNITERNSPFIDGGIFGMNLVYSLHFFKVGTCILNCNFSIEAESALRTLCEIPESEVFIMILACGNVPDKFKLATSKRLNINQILTVR